MTLNRNLAQKVVLLDEFERHPCVLTFTVKKLQNVLNFCCNQGITSKSLYFQLFHNFLTFILSISLKCNAITKLKT